MSQHEGGEMMFQRLFAPRAAVAAGRALCPPLIAQARSPVFYGEGGAPDTPEGRFELYTLHLALVVRRLRGEGDQAAEVSQALFDRFLSELDAGLREMGVGDLSVGKKMRKLGEAIYGRLKSYDAALANGAAQSDLGEVLSRTVYVSCFDTPPGPLAAYVRRADDALASAPLETLLEGKLSWVEAHL